MITTTITGRALWTAERGPPVAGALLTDVASSRWRRVASHVLEAALREPPGGAPEAVVLATTRLVEAERPVSEEFEPLIDHLGVRRRAIVSAGPDTVAMGLFEAASIAQTCGTALLLIVELTEAAELAIALRLQPRENGVQVAVTRVDPLPASTPKGALLDNQCRGGVSLFETNRSVATRLDPGSCGRYEVRFRDS